tara:strand:+ start:1378 stop:1818 length:441 start_codon:yes stop_codon:yes gene_type:complete
MRLLKSELQSLIRETIKEVYETKGDDEDTNVELDLEPVPRPDGEEAPEYEAPDLEEVPPALGSPEDSEAEVGDQPVSLDDVPTTLQELRIWLRDFVAPEVPVSQIAAFHKFVKMFMQKAKERQLKQQDPALTQRIGGKKKEDKKKK